MSFKLGTDFPREGFVQAAIERHFSAWERFESGFADLACRDQATQESWIIEAKGETTSVGLDFRTGLGQLLQGMVDPDANYGLAVPDTPKFRRQLDAVPSWVRSRMGLHWILVDDDGKVTVEPPPD